MQRRESRDDKEIGQTTAHPSKQPAERPTALAKILSGLAPLEEDFPDINDPPTKPEHYL